MPLKLNCLWMIGVLMMTRVVAQEGALFTAKELRDPDPIDQLAWEKLQPGAYVHFASADRRYRKISVPEIDSVAATWSARAWKGEKLHTQLLIWTTAPLQQVRLVWGSLTDRLGNTIDQRNISANFIRYVMTDGLNPKGSGCGIPEGLDSSLVEDLITEEKVVSVKHHTTQPVWLSVEVPPATPAGIYKGHVQVMTGSREVGKLAYTVQVLNRVLPKPSDWTFHLDLWQNPYAVARVHGVKPWSKAHFNAMLPYMKMLAAAGQKTITATLIHDPWKSQTEDIYGSMVKWVKTKQGSWRYDYEIFDQWVAFMMSLGVDKLINCYSMIPWDLKFYYYDEAAGKDTFLVAAPGTPAYQAHWATMLQDFARHLKQKGWFGKTTIAMDERSVEDMQKALAIIKGVDTAFKVSLAGNIHAEIESDLFDYSVASDQVIQNTLIQQRRKAGLITTFYTCCLEGFPNTFTFSPLAESTWLGWYAASRGFDGYLRWAYNCWPKHPLQDSRFGKWSAGDTYLVYPGPQRSIRFERLLEGIQDFEKIRILRKEFEHKQQTDKLAQLAAILSRFDIGKLKVYPADQMLQDAKSFLND